MIVKTQKIKIRNLREAVAHRTNKNKEKMKEIMQALKQNLKDVGYWRNKDKTFSEIIISEKLPPNVREETIQREWQKQREIMDGVRKELEAKGYEVVTASFHHRKRTIDNSVNVHTHFLFCLKKNGEIVELSKKDLRKIQIEILKKHDPKMYQAYTQKKSKNSRHGKKPIYDASQAPLWVCQKIKQKIQNDLRPKLKLKGKGLLGLYLDLAQSVSINEMSQSQEKKKKPHPPPEPPSPSPSNTPKTKIRGPSL